MARKSSSQERVIPVGLVRLRYLTATLGSYFTLLDQLERKQKRYEQEIKRLKEEAKRW